MPGFFPNVHRRRLRRERGGGGTSLSASTWVSARSSAETPARGRTPTVKIPSGCPLTVWVVGVDHHSHIVTAVLILPSWAATDGLVSVGWADDRPQVNLPPRSIGVRAGFYSEQIDGKLVNWLDPAMAEVEGRALAIIRRVERCWPLDEEDKSNSVAQFIALQMMRGPAWRSWYAIAVDRAADAIRAQRGRSPVAIRRTTEQMRSDSERHLRIVANLAPLATLIVNMHWTLLRCGSPRLATSDQPLCAVPDRRDGHRCVPNQRRSPARSVRHL